MRDIQVALLFLGRKRPGFDPEWGLRMQDEVFRFFQKFDFVPTVPRTQVVDDASLRVALVECATAHVLVVVQPTMSDGRLAPLIAQIWQKPVVLLATPEKPDGAMISSCSLVGAHAFAATLRQMGRPFEIVYGGHDWVETEQQLRRAISAVYSCVNLSKSKLALIGYHAPGFIDMPADPFLLSKQFGVQLLHVGLHEFIDLFHAQPIDLVSEDVRRARQAGVNCTGFSDEDLAIQSRFYLALKELQCVEQLDGIALRCWPEIPNVIGAWPYFAMARLVEDEFPLACEGDTDGALCCLLARNLGLGTVYLTDWLEHDRQHITVWHGGAAPLSFSETATLANHFNSKKPTVVDATIKSNEPVTLFRIWSCDGYYKMTAMEGRTVPPERHLLGSNGRVKLDREDLYTHFVDLCHEGMPHHLAVVRGHNRELLRQTARMLKLKFI